MKIVMLDPGHGGRDPGATGNGLREKDVVLSISKKIKPILKRHNVKVLQSRADDTFVNLSKRSQLANQAGADVFVSLHANDASNKQAQGIEVYAYPHSRNGKRLSKNILDSIVADKVYTKNRGVKTANFAVLRNTTMAACLVEYGFIGNAEDASILKNRQDELALATAKGILSYLGVLYKEGTQTKVDNYKRAVDTLVSVNIINSPDVWYQVENNNTRSLVIKMAAYINQGVQY